MAPKDARSLQLLFSDSRNLEATAVVRSLRDYHPTMAAATFEQGVIEWDAHRVRLARFDAQMPPDLVELCLAPAHFGPELKARARAHQSHALLYYAGTDDDPLNQYVVLAAACASLAKLGAIVILNEAGHTAFPAAALAEIKGDRLALLMSMPIPMLYSGFVKLEVEGVSGTWMRTFGNHLLGLPDFAHLAQGHHEGQATFDLICNLLSYLRSSGATFAPGHTTQVGEDTFLKFRAPQASEYFLENPGPLLVLEKVSKGAINTQKS